MKRDWNNRIAKLESPKLGGDCEACRMRTMVVFDRNDPLLSPKFRCPSCRRGPLVGLKLIIGVDPACI